MPRIYPRFLFLNWALLGLLIAVSTTCGETLRVLYFTKSSGWEHAVVRRAGGALSHSEQVLQKLGNENDIEFTFSKDGSLFSREYLAQFDVILFFTSGDLFSPGTDGEPPMTPAGKAALLDAIEAGQGFVGVHSSCDSFHTHESGGGIPADRSQRYIIHGEDSDPYIRMLGGEFISHGSQQVARATVVDSAFPGFEELGAVLEMKEEWYSTKEFREDLHCLLVLETAGMKGGDYARSPYPIAWARQQGEGRVWFNAMGHREQVWSDPRFQSMLLGGIEWVGGRVEVELTPNLDVVAPNADDLPQLH